MVVERLVIKAYISPHIDDDVVQINPISEVRMFSVMCLSDWFIDYLIDLFLYWLIEHMHASGFSFYL